MMTEKSTTVKSFKDLREGLANAKRERHAATSAEATALRDEIEKEQQTHPVLQDQPENGPPFVNDIAHSAQAAETIIDKARLEQPPFPPALSVPEPVVPKIPVMQSFSTPAPTATGPQASGQQSSPDFQPPRGPRPGPGQRREDRAQLEEMTKPPVPLTEEQQEICAWMYLQRQRELGKLIAIERRLGIIGQVVSIGVGILTIAGGIIAVRQGLKAAATDYKQ